jgi:cobalt/nickel transport system permease protein
MHMADALLSPAVGGAMWVASAATLVVCARKVSARSEDRLVPLMGVLGAFVFALQMINFAIPGTGSSGHLGGGLLLAILLGPWAAFLVIASVLAVQALFFADGGLLALGANLFNLGFLPCLVAYPLFFRPLAPAGASRTRTGIAAVVAAVVALQLGALGVVLQTVASGISSLPSGPFLALMLPIHLAIGLVEGIATAALVLFLVRARPDLVPAAPGPVRRRGLAGLAVTAALVAGVLSWFASPQPDGLEWSIARAAGTAELKAPEEGVHGHLATLQARFAPLPDYDLPGAKPAHEGEAAWPEVSAGTSFAGLVGAFVTLLLVAAAAFILRRRR